MFIFRKATVNNGLSLKSLAADLLNITLDKSLELRCSDWEADKLTPEQVDFMFELLCNNIWHIKNHSFYI